MIKTLRGDEVGYTVSADWWSYGVVLYEVSMSSEQPLKSLVLGSISDRFHYQKDLEPVSRPVTKLGLDPVSKRPSPKQQ